MARRRAWAAMSLNSNQSSTRNFLQGSFSAERHLFYLLSRAIFCASSTRDQSFTTGLPQHPNIVIFFDLPFPGRTDEERHAYQAFIPAAKQ
jgi:hypothetical protein